MFPATHFSTYLISLPFFCLTANYCTVYRSVAVQCNSNDFIKIHLHLRIIMIMKRFIISLSFLFPIFMCFHCGFSFYFGVPRISVKMAATNIGEEDRFLHRILKKTSKSELHNPFAYDDAMRKAGLQLFFCF